MNFGEAKKVIEKKFKGMVDADSHLYNAFLLVHSDKLNIHWNMAYGHMYDLPINAEQPYHTASIAKTFTALVIAILVEERKIDYEDPILKYLHKDIVEGLHIHRGKDYSKDIRIQHLVNNTSGLADFYEDKPRNGKAFLDILLEEPSRFWTPQETIQWTKENLSPRFPPGKNYYYSNTGFNLLGLIIESVTAKPLYKVLHEYIFQPCNMQHTYLSQYSRPIVENDYDVATVHLKNRAVNTEQHRSFSSIYAGGQTVSTSEDLLKFLRGLVSNQLISNDSLLEMMQWRKMWLGVDYGYGLMNVRMLPLTEKYNAWGHLGSIGSFMLYNPVMDVYIIGNFNKQGYLTKSMRFILSILRTLDKVKTISAQPKT